MIPARLFQGIAVAASSGLLCVGSSTALAAQARGVLAGIVVDHSTDAPVAGADVALVGTSLRSEADDHGVFIFPELPVGLVHVRVERPGYTAAVQQIEIRATGAADVEVRLVPMAMALRELLVTADRGARSPGYSVTEVSPERDSDLTAADLLAAHVPGLRVGVDRGVAGRGSSVRIRGTGTMTQSTAPSIYLDGVLIPDFVTSRVPNGVSALSVLSQIPAKEVARIRVFRGPSAGAQYPDATNGVIVIETIRGRGSKTPLRP